MMTCPTRRTAALFAAATSLGGHIQGQAQTVGANHTATPLAVATATSDTLVNPAVVFAACRHPDAEDRKKLLWNLCGGFQLPPSGMGFIPQYLSTFNARQLPKAWEIEVYARQVAGQSRNLPIIGALFGEAPEIRFGVDTTTVDSAARALINSVAPQVTQHLGRHADAVVVVTGMANLDKAGEDYNRDLAMQRARTVAAALVRSGVDYSRIEVAESVGLPDGIVTRGEEANERGVTIEVRMPRIAAPPGVPRSGPAFEVVAGEAAADLTAGSSPSAAEEPFALSLGSVAVQLSDVLMDRASEQMQVYVIRLLQSRLCDKEFLTPRKGATDTLDLKLFLTRTCSQFTQGTDWLTATGVRDLRVALASDFREMPERFAFKALQRRVEIAKNDTRYVDVANTAVAVLAFVDRIEGGEDPLLVLAEFTTGDVTTPWGGKWTLSRSGELATPLTEGLHRFARFTVGVNQTRKALAPYASSDWVVTDSVFAYTVRAAAVMLKDPIHFPEEDQIRLLMGNGYARLDDLLAGYRGVSDTFQRVREMLARLDTVTVTGPQAQEVRREIYGRLIGAVVDVAPSLFLVQTGSEQQQLRTLMDPLRRLVVSTRTQNYAAALPAALDLLRATATRLQHDMNREAMSLPFGREQHAIRIVSFASGIAGSQSEQQVNAAVREFVGQGRDFISKREAGTSFRVTLNAYVGLGGGFERLESAPAVGRRLGGYGSIAVPIGVEIGKACGAGVSCGIFVPLIDLGAIAATRFGGGDVGSTPQVSLETVVTPGFYGVLGLRGMPVSVGVGVTYAPESRQRSDGGSLPDGAERELNAFRFGGFIGIDIPLFP